MTNIKRLIVLEHALRPAPTRTGTPDPSRLTVFEAATLRSFSERIDRGGPDALSSDEYDVAIALAGKLYGDGEPGMHE